MVHKGTLEKDRPEIPGLDLVKAEVWRPKFLAVLASTGNVAFACKKVKVKRDTVYKHKRNDPAFAQEWKDSLSEAIDVVEGSLIHRATIDDTTAAIFLLKAHKPELYRERFTAEIAGIGGAPIRLVTPIERDVRLAELIARGLRDDGGDGPV
jgi:hypothetical protein